MKKTIALFLTGIAIAACNKQHLPSMRTSEYGTILVSIAPQDGRQTKSVTAYTTARSYETKVNNVQVLIFGDDGKINYYKDLGSKLSGELSITSGIKTVYAVVNGPDLSDIATISDLEAVAVDLSANSTSDSNGFVMAGKTTCSVSSGSVNCSVPVSRLVARITLKSISNKLPSSYGDIQIKRVFLANVVGNQNLSGIASTNTWYNQEGRMDETPLVESHIIDGVAYTASCPELTYRETDFKVVNGSSHDPIDPLLLYCYPNSCTTAPGGFSPSFSPQRSVLVIAAIVNEALFYYPVVLDNAIIDRNTSYSVALTVSSIGSLDPNNPVDKGAAEVSVSIEGWKTGASYEETI